MDPQENDQVAKMVGGLKRVNAPANFESRVQARIARVEKPKNAWAFGFLKIGLPVAALGALALFFYLASYSSIKQTDVVVRANTNSQPVRSPNPDSLPGTVVAPTNDKIPHDDIAGVNRPTVNTNIALRPKKEITNRGGGSMDQGFNAAPQDKMPPGFNTNPTQIDPGNRPVRTSVPAEEILRYAGVQSEARANQLVAGSVVASSPAEKWGVKAGDIIEALNEVKVTPSSSFPSGVSLKSIRVRRNGKSVNLKF